MAAAQARSPGLLPLSSLSWLYSPYTATAAVAPLRVTCQVRIYFDESTTRLVLSC